jgi:hypothetical protein
MRVKLERNDPQAAVEIAMRNNQFKLALEVIKSHQVPVVSETLAKYTA